MGVKPIGWGIMGTGRIARGFAAGLTDVPGARLVAIGSRSQESAARFAGAFGAPKAHPTYAALLADPSVQVVYIATPQHRHAEDALACLSAGKAVLCEKPFTTTAAEAKAVAGAARVKGVFCMEAMWMRCMPLVQEVKRALDSGAIGEPLALTGDFGYPTGASGPAHLYDPKRGGGALLDRGVYLVSLCDYLFGPAGSHQASVRIGPSGVDEQCALILSFPNGVRANLLASLKALCANEVVLMGTRGTIRMHAPFYKPHRLTIKQFGDATFASAADLPGRPGALARAKAAVAGSTVARGLYHRFEGLAGRLTGKSGHTVFQTYAGNGYNFEAAEVTRCLQSGLKESPVMPLAATERIMELMDAIRRDWRA